MISWEGIGREAALTYYVEKIQNINVKPGGLDSDATPLGLNIFYLGLIVCNLTQLVTQLKGYSSTTVP